MCDDKPEHEGHRSDREPERPDGGDDVDLYLLVRLGQRRQLLPPGHPLGPAGRSPRNEADVAERDRRDQQERPSHRLIRGEPVDPRRAQQEHREEEGDPRRHPHRGVAPDVDCFIGSASG